MRRKISADLKEALCKLYEAGDLTAEAIERNGIMVRNTFYHTLRIWKAGISLEQGRSTGRKTNADKQREQEAFELERLQPASLAELHLTLLDDRSLSDPEEEQHVKDEWRRLHNEARLFCLRCIKEAYGIDYTPAWHDDLDSLLTPDGNQYSAKHRGAFWIVRHWDDPSTIIATIGLRSFIWKPQLYQSLGERYASKSIDRVGYIGRIYIDPTWRRRGIGRWLTGVAELKASRLGFSTMYLHADSKMDPTLQFWRSMEYLEFAQIEGNTHFDKSITPNVPPPLPKHRGKGPAPDPAKYSSPFIPNKKEELLSSPTRSAGRRRQARTHSPETESEGSPAKRRRIRPTPVSEPKSPSKPPSDSASIVAAPRENRTTVAHH